MSSETAPPAAPNWSFATDDATALAARVRAGEATPAELLEAAIARAETVGRRFGAIASIERAAAEKTLAEASTDGPLYGVPFLLKDLGAEAHDFPTNAGSRLFAGTRHGTDSAIYARLKAAGLVTFGRTTSPELGIGPATESQVYDAPTRNPWNPDCTAGGSSGGAGACVAAGVLPAAHGSDGGGSVRIPAACCGLVGFKATRARLPDGPYAGEGWGGMAIDGFLTRSVRDSALLLDATAGPDLGAPYWAPPLTTTFGDAIARPPRRLRIAVCATTLDGAAVHPDCQAAVFAAAKIVEDLGHEVVDALIDPTLEPEAMMRAWTKIVACGTANSVDGKVARAALDPTQIEGVTRGALAYADTLSGSDYLGAVEDVHDFGRRMAAYFEAFDVLLTPTLAEPPAEIGRFKPDNEDFLDYRNGPRGVFAYSPFCALFNASGQPAVSLPLAWSPVGLPIGVQFAAKFGEDLLLASLAAEVETAAAWAPRQRALIDRIAADASAA